MTTVELERLARTKVPPVGATGAVAVVDHQPGGRLSKPLDAYPSGIGGRTRFGAAWQIDGLAATAPIATFDRQDDALRLVHILNGTAPRVALAPTTPDASSRAVQDPARPGVPGPEPGTPDTAGGVCAGCGCPLPPGRRGQRRLTCSPACRQRARRRHADEATATDADSGASPVTPSGLKPVVLHG